MKSLLTFLLCAGAFGQTAFYPLAPCRIADTRSTTYPSGLGAPALTSGAVRSFPILASSCGVPSTAVAYSLNITAVPSGPLGYLTLFATGQPQPVVSTLNATSGLITANAAVVPAGTGGAISAYASGATNLVIDINGYFAPLPQVYNPVGFTTSSSGVSSTTLLHPPSGSLTLFRNGMYESPVPTASGQPDYILSGLVLTLTLPVQPGDTFIAIY